jgi:hypothetical protein
LGVELWRVFRLQLVPSRRLEENRHGIILAAEFGDLVDDFVGDSRVPIVLAIFCHVELWPN